MNLNLSQISEEGLILDEKISARGLELETDDVKFRGPIKIRAFVARITNVVIVDMVLNATIDLICGRCLSGFGLDLKKTLRLNYQAEKTTQIIDLDPEIREEIILDYPIKPLCKPDCKGLCPKCGINLNEKNCDCN